VASASGTGSGTQAARRPPCRPARGAQAFYAPAPAGTVDVLVAELRALGAESIRAEAGGAAFRGDLMLAYRVCMWSRVASRLLLELGCWVVSTPAELYAAVQTICWSDHLTPTQTLAVACSGRSASLPNSHYAALKVKDAVVDQFRARCGVRPGVDRLHPDVSLDLHLAGRQAILSLDLAGPPLHQRGYRVATVAAPMKENLAAAILLGADWPQVAAAGGALVDPMCGSGTLLLEAALLAGDGAPGMWRERFGFLGWRQHDREQWRHVQQEARERWAAGRQRLPRLLGCDVDPSAVAAARQNVRHAELGEHIRIERGSLADCAARLVSGLPPGLVVTNPPYGRRLHGQASLGELYAELGAVLRRHFGGWRAAVLCGAAELAGQLGLRPWRSRELRNGPLPCRLVELRLPGGGQPPPRTAGPAGSAAGALAPAAGSRGGPAAPVSAGAGDGRAMFANRLRKNFRELGRWAQREGIACYRLYDADMPEYSLAVDLYRSDELHVHVQEYQAPASIEPQAAAARLAQALAALPDVLPVRPESVYVKLRQRQRGRAQYRRLAPAGEFHRVAEGPGVFWVNFTCYLDTGLFLDHRLTRALVARLAGGRDVLNLFGYTATATVYAALGGAASTTTVDMSRTYLDWARRNLALNGLDPRRHRLLQADCLDWLRQEHDQRYGLIFLDPPTFSNSKRMRTTFDVQRDHVSLLQQVARLLTPDGVLIFATNCRRFRLAAGQLVGLRVEDVTAQTIPRDFARNPRIHRCWLLTRAASPAGRPGPPQEDLEGGR